MQNIVRAQKENTDVNDWIVDLKYSIDTLEIEITDEELVKITKQELKKVVKEKENYTTFKYLIKEAERLKKFYFI